MSERTLPDSEKHSGKEIADFRPCPFITPDLYSGHREGRGGSSELPGYANGCLVPTGYQYRRDRGSLSDFPTALCLVAGMLSGSHPPAHPCEKGVVVIGSLRVRIATVLMLWWLYRTSYQTRLTMNSLL